jgi:uncharacterized membrane protein YhiD involved in acid resistance
MAYVVSGIGFLGASAIMKEGLMVSRPVKIPG